MDFILLRINRGSSCVPFLFLASFGLCSPALATAAKDSLNGWYGFAKVGSQKSTIDNPLSINNGSGFPAPYDKDIYTTNTKSSAVAGVGAGYYWSDWALPGVSLGINYSHYFNSANNGQIIQYGLPEFTNYNYQWKTTSDLVLASAKLDLYRWNALAPYIQGGVGFSANKAKSYSEQALAGVTPRISPQFASHSTTVFAYQLGVGLDWAVKPQWVVSLGYEYTDLGKFSSGNGINSWSGDALSSGKLNSNAGVLGVTYLFH